MSFLFANFSSALVKVPPFFPVAAAPTFPKRSNVLGSSSSSSFFFSSSLAGVTLLLRALTTTVVVSLVDFDDFEGDSSFLSFVFVFCFADDVFFFLVVSVLFLTFFTGTFLFLSSAPVFTSSSRLFFLLTHFVGSCHSCAAMICASSRLPIFIIRVVVVLLLARERSHFTLFELI